MTIRQNIKLTAVQQQSLRDMESDIEWLEREIFRAENAGIDVSKLKESLVELQKVREGLQREYV